MPYIQRDNDGVIISLTQTPDDKHLTHIPPTDPEIVDFLTENHGGSSAKDTLSESDKDFTRATEDLINLLIEKNIILFTELPPAVQAKMVGREKLRSNLTNNAPYNFLDDGESI